MPDRDDTPQKPPWKRPCNFKLGGFSFIFLFHSCGAMEKAKKQPRSRGARRRRSRKPGDRKRDR
eukprot:scaffold6012_cov115-Pinguiococcus_pyrenoidosus.AAC.1